MFRLLEQKMHFNSHYNGIIIAFILGFFVRLIPELLSFPFPIGWDTIYYASRMNSGVVFAVGSDLVNSWLVYGILAALTNLSNLNPFIILKLFSPLLSGATCAAVYFVAYKKLNWSSTKSLLVSVLSCFQISFLAISWQFYRNMFGIIFLLLAFPFIKKDSSNKELIALSVLALFTVWGHELAMLSLFFIVFITLVVSAFKKEKISWRLFVAILPAILLFMGNFFWISPFATPTNTNIVRVDDSIWAHPQGLFFITDYLNVLTPIESYTSYFNLISNVTTLFLILYGPILALVVIGHFKDRTLNIWTTLLLLGALGCLIVPSFGLFLWARWMLLLIFPFSFFAANGLWKITKSLPGNKILTYVKKFKTIKAVCLAIFYVSILLSCLFMIYPESDNGQSLINWGGSAKYFPSTMQSSSIPLKDIDATEQAFSWLNTNMKNNSALLVHDAFDNWALLYLNTTHQAYLFDFNLQQAAKYAKNQGYTNLYFIWWNKSVTKYNIQLSNQWKPIRNYERISIYQLTNPLK